MKGCGLWRVGALLGVLLSLATGSSHAGVVSGRLWHVADSVAQNAVPANVPSRAPDVTFDVNSPLNFNNPGTVIAFLNSGAAFNIVEATPSTLASLISNGVTSTLIDFVGLVTVMTGQTFAVAHDDGLTLIIGGINLGLNAGPTAPVVSLATYTGPSGTFPFELVYGECCGGNAVLRVDLPFVNSPSAVPEPTTIALLGIGVLGMTWRRSGRSVRRMVTTRWLGLA